MKNKFRYLERVFLSLCIVFLSLPLAGQLSINFTAGNSAALHELSVAAINPFDVNSFGIGLSYVPKKIGLGLQLSTSSFIPNQNFISQFDEFVTKQTFEREKWRNDFLFLGPVFKIGGQKLNLEFFPKFGLGNIQSSDWNLNYISSAGTEHLLYADNADEKSLRNLQLFSGFDTKLTIGITKKIGLHVYAGINTNRFFGEGNSTTYREVNVQGDGIAQEELIAGRLLQLDCESYDLINVGAGITLALTKNKDKPHQDPNRAMSPPKPVYPENQSKIGVTEAESLLLEWNEEAPAVKKANYILSLYQKGDEQSKDSLVFTTKVIRQSTLELPKELKLRTGVIYKWKVQAVDDNELKPCPGGCNSTDYEFEITPLAIPQYYQLLAQDRGSHVLINDRLRIIIDENVLMTDAVNLEVLDEAQTTVLELKNIQQANNQLESFDFDRYELDVRKLKPDAYYLLKVSNGDRNYYLRFYKDNETNEQSKN